MTEEVDPSLRLGVQQDEAAGQEPIIEVRINPITGEPTFARHPEDDKNTGEEADPDSLPLSDEKAIRERVREAVTSPTTQIIIVAGAAGAAALVLAIRGRHKNLRGPLNKLKAIGVSNVLHYIPFSGSRSDGSE